MNQENEVIAILYTYGGGKDEPVNLDAYLNAGGLITLRIDEERWIELSAIHAKKFRNLLDQAIGDSLAQHISPTE